MAVNDTVQLSVIGSVLGQVHIHTLHFRFQQATSTDQGLINSYQAAVRSLYRALFSTVDQPCVRYVARQVCGTVPLRAPAEEVEISPNIFGSRTTATDPLSPFMAAVASTRTASAGKSRRGRYFIGGVYEGDQSGGNLTSTYLGIMAAYSAGLLATYELVSGTDLEYKLVVHSPKLAAVPGQQCQNSSTPITGIINRSVLGTMKSRRPGSGL